MKQFVMKKALKNKKKTIKEKTSSTVEAKVETTTEL